MAAATMLLAVAFGSLWAQGRPFVVLLAPVVPQFRQSLTAFVEGTATLASLLSAKKGHEMESAVTSLFKHLPYTIPTDSVKDKQKSKELLGGLGYFCLNEGTVSGLKTIKKNGETELIGENPTKISVPFVFEDLVFQYDKCGFQTMGMMFKFKCKVTLKKHKFYLDFVINQPVNARNLLSGVFKRRCFFKIADMRLQDVTKFKLEMCNRDGSAATMDQAIARMVVSNMTNTIKKKINRSIRGIVYRALKSEGFYVCRDQALEDVMMKYKVKTKNKGRTPLSDKFQQLCTDEKPPSSGINSRISRVLPKLSQKQNDAWVEVPNL